MNDLEINKALALAIGWKESSVMAVVDTGRVYVYVYSYEDNPYERWREFDYKDWAVICPIAKRYDMTVDFRCNVAWTGSNSIGSVGNSPQKAMALEAIKRAKK